MVEAIGYTHSEMVGCRLACVLKDYEIRALIMPFTERTGGVVSALHEILQAEGYSIPFAFR